MAFLQLTRARLPVPAGPSRASMDPIKPVNSAWSPTTSGVAPSVAVPAVPVCAYVSAVELVTVPTVNVPANPAVVIPLTTIVSSTAKL